jgi:polyhydroxyalkanoate synthesis regulator phasin
MTDERSELQKIADDMVMYGKTFIRDGKRVAPEDVYISPGKVMTDDLVKRLRRYPYDFTEEAADRIEQLEKALKFLIECENWTKLVAEVEGKPYTNSGLQWARQVLEGS